MEGEIWGQDYKMHTIVYLRSQNTGTWMVKPLRSGCMLNTNYIWLGKSSSSEKIDPHADQKQEINFVWPNACSSPFGPSGSPLATAHVASSVLASTLPILFLVNSWTHGFVQVPQSQETALLDERTWDATAKFKFCQYFFTVGLGPSRQIKDHQYFWYL